MRNISEVLQFVRDTVPNTIDKYSVFLGRLNKLQSDICYTAPEAMRDRWVQLGYICQEFIGNYKDTPWEINIRNKFQESPENQLER